MRPFKISNKYLSGLDERLTAVQQPDIARAMKDFIILGDCEDMDGGICTACEEEMTIAYLLPAYGYVCANCGILLVVRGLYERLAATGDFTLPPRPTPVPAPIPTPPPHLADVIIPEMEPVVRRAETPVEPPKVLKEMMPYSKVAPGTMMRVPIRTFRLGQPQADPLQTMVTAIPIAPVFTDEAAAGSARIVKMAANEGHLIIRPDVDLTSLPPNEREEFSGYRPGHSVIRGAADVAAYEQTYGDPEVVAALNDIDDQDQDMVAQEALIREGRERRGMSPEMPSFDRMSNGGAVSVQLHNPEVRQRRLDRESGVSEFEPLKPID